MITTIRPARLSDANEIARIHLETWQDAYKGIISDARLQALSLQKRKKKWNEILSDPKNTLFVAETDGKLYGFCGYGKSRDKDADTQAGEIYAIYVDHRNYSQGFGGGLIKEAFGELKKQDFTKATVWVLEENLIGKRFYEKQGMKLDGESKIDTIEGQALKEVRYYIDL